VDADEAGVARHGFGEGTIKMVAKSISAKKLLGALVGAVSLLGMTAGANAADLLTSKSAPPAPTPVAAPQLGFFVKLGATYAINNSTSKLYSQVPFALAHGVTTQFEIPGVGAKVANVFTAGFEAGYFVTPNISIDVSGGIPMYAAVTTKGTIPASSPVPPIPSGTRLSSVMPSFVPITALYHFTQWGQFQPYVGAGIAPVFSFAQKSGFNTGVTVDPTVGLVLQAGTDVMFDNHWGWSLDVKRLFANATSHSTGDNLAAVFGPHYPTVPIAGTLKINFQPWILSTGVTYRF
jgi:outer membrane protein